MKSRKSFQGNVPKYIAVFRVETFKEKTFAGRSSIGREMMCIKLRLVFCDAPWLASTLKKIR